MLEMNKVMLIGNLTRDPELSYIASGTALAKLGLAVNRRYRGRDGEQKEDTAFVDVDAWGKTAEFCSKYLGKGKRIYVEGRLKYDRWQAQDGSNRSKLLVTAERVEFADPPRSSGSSDGQVGRYNNDAGPQNNRPASAPQQQSTAPADNGPDAGYDDSGADDDLPF